MTETEAVLLAAELRKRLDDLDLERIFLERLLNQILGFRRSP